MGEYVRYKGEDVKIGTCETMYYTSYQKFVKALPFMKKIDGNIEPVLYLKENGIFWRFPFPQDDNKNFGETDSDYDHSLQIMISKELYESFELQGHANKTISLQPNCGGHNINIQIPCPYSEDFKTVKSYHKTGGYFEGSKGLYALLSLRYQKHIDGKLYPVVECPYCGSMWTVDTREEVAKLIKGIRKFKFYGKYDSNYKYFNDICLRMIKGLK